MESTDQQCQNYLLSLSIKIEVCMKSDWLCHSLNIDTHLPVSTYHGDPLQVKSVIDSLSSTSAYL